jgi:hypothetical protein
MNRSDRGASDGSVGIDSSWKRRLTKALAETPLAPTLLDAARPLVGLLNGTDLEDLEAVIEDKREEWAEFIYSEASGFNLPRTYPLDYAVGIHLYTHYDPAVFSVVNEAMFNPARRKPGAAG